MHTYHEWNVTVASCFSDLVPIRGLMSAASTSVVKNVQPPSAGSGAGDTSSSSSSGGFSKPTPKQEEIIKGFQKLRQEQHALSEKVSEIKSQIAEHKNVIAALEKVFDRFHFIATLGLIIQPLNTKCSSDNHLL